MALFRRKSKKAPLPREQSLAARPVLNPLVKLERDEQDNVILQVPRRDSAMTRFMARFYRMPGYKRVALDELGSFVIELCDGRNTAGDIIDKFAKRFKLNRREAELSMVEFMRSLARRSIIGLVIDQRGA